MNPLGDLIRNLGPVRIVALFGTAVSVIGFFIFLASQISTGGMSLLYGDLDPADSGAIVNELEARDIKYELKAGGQQIFVQEDEVLRLRVSLAEQGVPGGGTIGYEIFDKSDGLGTTNFVQNVNLVRALEGELARTIGSMNNVRGARVHLVLPQRELFSRERRKPSASVVLQVQRAGRLGREQVLAIQHLIAAAVPDMEPQNISILDSRGQLLARGTNEEDGTLPGQSSEEMRLAFENRVRSAVEELVERIVGLGRVRAEISANIDYDRLTEQSEIFDPDSQVARSTQTIEENESSRERDTQNTVSVENNLPEAEANSGDSDLSAFSQSARTEETVNFEISRTVRNRVKEAGEIRTLSVAVLVDGRYIENEDGDKIYQPRTEKELEQIATLVRSAVGYDGSRGDTVEVVNMQFVKLEPLDLEDGSLLFGISKGEFLELAEVLILAVVGILVILLVVRPVLTRLFESMPTTAAAGGGSGRVIAGADAIAQLTGPGASADLAEFMAQDEEEEEESLLDQMIDINRVEGRVRTSSLKKIGDIIENHPEEAIAIIRNWMYQDSGNDGGDS